MMINRHQNSKSGHIVQDQGLDPQGQGQGQGHDKQAKARTIQNTSVVRIRSYCKHWNEYCKYKTAQKNVSVWKCGFYLFSKICLHCTWLVLSHIVEYHLKALSTMPLSHTDQMPSLSTLAFQTPYTQHHAVYSSQRHLVAGPVIIIYRFRWCSGVERSSVSRTAALMTLTPRSKPMARTWALRPRPRTRTSHTVLKAKNIASRTTTLPKLHYQKINQVRKLAQMQQNFQVR